MDEMLRDHPDEGVVHVALALIHAGLGHRDEAVDLGKRGIELSMNNATNRQKYTEELY